jgi:hypothetical protein
MEQPGGEHPTQGHLLTRLEVLVSLAVDHDGLALDRQGQLVTADAQLVADALALGDAPQPTPRELAAIELLRGLAQAIGLLRDRGERLEATTLRHPWRQLDPELRAGLVYAAWCTRMPWAHMLGDTDDPLVHGLSEARVGVLRLLFDLGGQAEVDLADFTAALVERLGLPDGEPLARAVAAVFLDPLVALGVAEMDPPSASVPRSLRLDPRARHIIGSALVATGQDLPPDAPPGPRPRQQT